MVQNLPASARDTKDLGSILKSGRSPGEGNGNPLQYSCLETPMDRGAWWAIVYGATKLDTTIHACTVALRVPGGLGLNPSEHTGGGLVARSCLTLFHPMDCSPPGSSVHGSLQTRKLEWVSCPPPGNLPVLGIKPASLMSPALAGGFFTH